MPLGHTQDDAPGASGGPSCLFPAGPTQKVQERAPMVRKSSLLFRPVIPAGAGGPGFSLKMGASSVLHEVG